MKYLINCTVIVYLAQIQADWIDQVATTTTVRVVEEAGHLLTETQKEGVMKNVEVIPSGRMVDEDHYLSKTDLELAHVAKEHDYLLITDDKKLKNRAKTMGAKSIDLPHWIEFMARRKAISKEEALKSLNRLEKKYNRKKMVRIIIKRIHGGD